MTRNEPKECAVFGIDIGKTLFHLVGLDERGAPVQKAKFRRASCFSSSSAPVRQ